MGKKRRKKREKEKNKLGVNDIKTIDIFFVSLCTKCGLIVSIMQ